MGREFKCRASPGFFRMCQNKPRRCRVYGTVAAAVAPKRRRIRRERKKVMKSLVMVAVAARSAAMDRLRRAGRDAAYSPMSPNPDQTFLPE